MDYKMNFLTRYPRMTTLTCCCLAKANSKANVETAKVQGLLSIVKALLSNTNTTPKRYTFFLTTSPAATPCSSQRPWPRPTLS